MMKLGILIAAAVTMVAGTANAQTGDWRHWSQIGDGENTSMMFIDASSRTEPASGIAEISSASYFRAEQNLGDEVYSVLWIRYRFDCAAGTYQIVGTAAWYREQSILASDKPLSINKVAPDTPMSRLRDGTCSNSLDSARPIKGKSPEAEGRSFFRQ